MTTLSTNREKSILQEDKSDWFDDVVANLRSIELQLETNTADTETRNLFGHLISGDMEELLIQNTKVARKFFIEKMLVDYLKRLGSKKPQKLAFDLEGNEILVWAQVSGNDESEEDNLLMVEAKINSVFHDKGYNLTTTIVEETDSLSIPNQYFTFI